MSLRVKYRRSGGEKQAALQPYLHSTVHHEPINRRVDVFEFRLRDRAGVNAAVSCQTHKWFDLSYHGQGLSPYSVFAVFRLDSIMLYINGSANIVNNVDVINPPMTTVANGRCTSAPVP